MSNSLLPPSASNFMRCAEAVGTRITDIPVDLNTLWSPDTCPVHLLPYLAWAFSVDRWDRNWPEETKRQVIRDAWLITEACQVLAISKSLVDVEATVSPEISASAVKAEHRTGVAVDAQALAVALAVRHMVQAEVVHTMPVIAEPV